MLQMQTVWQREMTKQATHFAFCLTAQLSSAPAWPFAHLFLLRYVSLQHAPNLRCEQTVRRLSEQGEGGVTTLQAF